MPKTLSLSVIVPVYNERYLVEASLKRLASLAKAPGLAWAEVLVVDDGSSDGSAEVLGRLAAKLPKAGRLRFRFLSHPKNRGKGAAFRTGLAEAKAQVTVIHDADLEYFPADLAAMLAPFIEAGADAVYGSRYLPRPYTRVQGYRHSLRNQAVTAFANFLTDLSLSDSATCYKAVRTDLLKSIPLEEDDFRFEPELTVKLARRGAQIFEVPINYAGRAEAEGKKLRLSDGFKALAAYARHRLQDRLFVGARTNLFARLERARRYQGWMADLLRPYLGREVLELGAKTGHLTRLLVPRDRYVAAESDPAYAASLAALSFNRPYLKTLAWAPGAKGAPKGLFDTVLSVNGLAEAQDPGATLKSMAALLKPGGRLVLLVPSGLELMGSLEEALGWRQRFADGDLEALFHAAGLEQRSSQGFNRLGSLGWRLNSVFLRRRSFGLLSVKLQDLLVPLLRRLDPLLPFPPLSRLIVAVKVV